MVCGRCAVTRPETLCAIGANCAMRNRPHLCAAGAMGRDGLEGDGLGGLLAVSQERVDPDSVAEAGGPAALARPARMSVRSRRKALSNY